MLHCFNPMQSNRLALEETKAIKRAIENIRSVLFEPLARRILSDSSSSAAAMSLFKAASSQGSIKSKLFTFNSKSSSYK